MDVVGAPGLLRGEESRSDCKRKGASDETVVTTSSSTTVKRSNMAQDNLYPFQSIEDYVGDNSDIMLQHLQRNPALLLAIIPFLFRAPRTLAMKTLPDSFWMLFPRSSPTGRSCSPTRGSCSPTGRSPARNSSCRFRRRHRT